MITSSRVRAFAALLVTLGALTGHAQNAPATGWSLDLGVGAIVNPEFQGGDEYQVRPIPFFDARYSDARGELLFANVPQGIGGYLYRNTTAPGFSTRIGMAIGPGFATRDDEIPGLDDVDIATEARIFLQVNRGGWAGSARLAQDLGTGHEGAYLDLGIDRRGRLGNRGFWTLGPSIRIVDADYADSQYGVDARSAVAAALAPHDAGSGVEQVSLQGLVSVPMGKVWRFTSVVSVGRLVGDRGDSPIVQNKTQGFALMAVTRPVGRRAPSP